MGERQVDEILGSVVLRASHLRANSFQGFIDQHPYTKYKSAHDDERREEVIASMPDGSERQKCANCKACYDDVGKLHSGHPSASVDRWPHYRLIRIFPPKFQMDPLPKFRFRFLPKTICLL